MINVSLSLIYDSLSYFVPFFLVYRYTYSFFLERAPYTERYRTKSGTNIVDCRSKSRPVSFYPSRNFRNIFEERERKREEEGHPRSYVRSFTNGNGKWRNRRPLLYIKLYEVNRAMAILSRFVCCRVAGKWWISHKGIRISLNL